MDSKPILIAIAAATAAAWLAWLAIQLPRIKKKCHKEGFEAGVKFADKLDEETRQVKGQEDSNALEKTVALTRIRCVLINFEKKFKDLKAKKQEILKDERLSPDEKMRRILGLDKELESWVEAQGMA